jgi:hypothetical protein
MASATGVGVKGIADHEIHLQGKKERRRRISPQAGRALEILGHAIEYLTDQYVNEIKSLSASDPEVSAIRLLMSLNREIYLECPIAPTASERIRMFLLG